MAITVLILFLFIGLVLAVFLLLRFSWLKSVEGKTADIKPHPQFEDQVTAFDRFSIRVIVIMVLVIVTLLMVFASLFYDFYNKADQAAALLLFIFITATGFLFFLKKESAIQARPPELSSNIDDHREKL